MRSLIFYLSLLLAFSCVSSKNIPIDKEGRICNVLNNEKILGYLHLDKHLKFDTIKLYGKTSFFNTYKQNQKCLGKTIAYYEKQMSTQVNPLEFNILKIDTLPSGYKIEMQYKFEGLFIKVFYPKVINSETKISVDIIEQ